MTRQEILNMTKEELNEAVAINAMGWHIIHATRDYMTCPGHIYPLEDWWVDEKGETQYLVKDWNPTEKIEYAWRVAKKVAQEWPYFEISHDEHFDERRCSNKTDEGLPIEGMEISEVDKSECLAICRAALMAVEGE